MIQALVFDFDGLIFDSERHEYDVIRGIFAEHGAELPLEVWGWCIGRAPGSFDPLAYLEECTGRPVDRTALERLREERFGARIAGEGPLPGVEEALREARELGLKLGVASSSPRAWVEGQLGRLALREHFDCVRTRDDVRRAKPDPELYLAVCDCLGVEPAAAVALEDSPNGLLAARRAGLRCVVVPNTVTAGLEFGGDDGFLRLDTLLGVTVRDLLTRLAAE
ncbi:MAG TPA: HAD-IA family hydrolase [Longimicrobiaceae bacterium]|nr:HAD-IA family hydrolase [Longimicrobiaceae bacterium]